MIGTRPEDHQHERREQDLRASSHFITYRSTVLAENVSYFNPNVFTRQTVARHARHARSCELKYKL